MVNTEIRLIIFFAPKDGEALSSHKKQDWELTVAQTESEVTQSCLTLCDPMSCRPPGSSIHGIFQARVLEWGATARMQK